MKVSVDWLQTFFDEPLPSVDEITNALTFGVAEIEGVEKVGTDSVIDVNVLPDRAPYMLCHRGVAKEVSILLNIPMKEDALSAPVPDFDSHKSALLSVSIDDEKRCPAYSAAVVKGVSIGPSPEWLRIRLEALGQRSINNVVDATNYVMFTLGTPLHAFDAERLVGEAKKISVRAAKTGEKITVLGGDEYELTEEMTVIADGNSDSALAIAGVKGGIVAEVGESTKDIVLEAAKFDPTRTRKTSQSLKLRTDASYRFENEIADMLPRYGLEAVAKLIIEIAGGELEGYAYQERQQSAGFKVGVSVGEVNRRLGTSLNESEFEGILKNLGFVHSKISNPIDKVLEIGESLVGAKYKRDSAIRFDAPNLFSCSSLVNYLFVQVGVSLPSISIDQYVWSTPVEEADLQAGDLIFSNTNEGKVRFKSEQWLAGTDVPEGVDHEGLYIGDGKVLHASSNPGSVVIEELSESPMFKEIVGYRRALSENELRFVVTVPFERLDLRAGADLIEEIGRVYGYDNIPEKQLPSDFEAPVINQFHAYSEKLRSALAAEGFEEVYTYTLRDSGEVALSNALASDKSHLRENLSDALSEKLDSNESNMPLLGMDSVAIYEIGNVFNKTSEELRLAVAVRFPSGKKSGTNTSEKLESAKRAINEVFGKDCAAVISSENSMEWNLSELILDSPEVSEYIDAPVVESGVKYKPVSPYPFVLRDVAAWTPEGTTAEQFKELIRSEAGELLMRAERFDEFTKDGRTSYAFRLVFQSGEKTLTDEEVNKIMDKIYEACSKAGFETR